MNFSRAVKGHLTRTGAIRAIHSQGETELGRKLTKEEEKLLLVNTNPNNLLAQIEKVRDFAFKVFILKYSSFSMDMDSSSLSCF